MTGHFVVQMHGHPGSSGQEEQKRRLENLRPAGHGLHRAMMRCPLVLSLSKPEAEQP